MFVWNFLLKQDQPARGGQALHCSAAEAGEGAVDGPQGAGAWETGSVTGGEASEKDSEGDSPVVHPALWGAAGCTVGNPEVELGVCSSHLDGPVTGRGGSGDGEH